MAREEDRTEEQIAIDKIQAERERFDLDSWKDRAPMDLVNTRLCIFADEQQIYRRNLEAIISLRKTLVGDNKNDELLKVIDAKATECIASLKSTELSIADLVKSEK